jgi:hypothetical protein
MARMCVEMSETVKACLESCRNEADAIREAMQP